MKEYVAAVNHADVLRLLGYRGGEIGQETLLQIDTACKAVCETAKPRYTYRIFDIVKSPQGILLSGTEFTLPGADIARLLKDCKRCILLAATIGIEVEALMRRQPLNLAAVSDSCASSAIEEMVNDVHRDLQEEYRAQSLYLTDRFSPGYGNLPITVQRPFCSILETQKRIGLTVSGSGLLIPRKSVTAVIGIANTPQEMRITGCEHCDLSENCTYRKGGTACAD